MHPIAFEVGPFSVRWYGVMVAVAFVVGIWSASRRATQVGITGEKVVDLSPWLLIGAIVGARCFYVVGHWQEHFSKQPFGEIFMIHHGGLVFYGGLVGASLGCILYASLKGIPLWDLADVLAPSIPLGSAIGRIGCLMNGCCFGKACDLPWAIRFPKEHETSGIPVHPTQVYDALLNFFLFIFLRWLFRRRKFKGGVFAAYLLCYPILRSLAELFRGDYQRKILCDVVTPAHIVSVPIFLAGILLFFALKRKAPRVISDQAVESDE